jgi:hypothetical protein
MGMPACSKYATGAFTWAFPGSPVQIHLRLEVVERLANELRQSLANSRDQLGETGGLLLGRVAADRNSTEITEHRPLSNGHWSGQRYVLQQSDRERLMDAKAESKSLLGAPFVVGYYRTHVRPNLFLDEDDMSLMRECFPEPHSVALLIKPSRVGSPVAGFFFWDKGQINSEFSFLEFPFNTIELAENTRRVPKSRIPAEKFKALARSSRFQGWFRNCGASLSSKRTWAIAALLIIAPAVFTNRRFLADKLQLRTIHSNAGTVNRAGLQVETHGLDLRVSWSQTGSAIDRAEMGILSIKDGESERRVYLHPDQLRNGSAFYSPKTENVRFRLEILSPSGETADEQVVAIVPQAAGPRMPINSKENTLRSADRLRFPEPLQPTKTSSLSQQPRTFKFDTLRRQPELASTGVVTEPPPLVKSNPLGPSSIRILDELRSAALPPYAPTTKGSLPAPNSSVNSPAEGEKQVQQATADVRDTYVPPKPLTQVQPVISPGMRAMLTGEVHVNVRVNLDETGRIISAKAEDLDGSTVVFFVAPALKAARHWKFQPARLGSRNVPADVILQFKFTSSR